MIKRTRDDIINDALYNCPRASCTFAVMKFLLYNDPRKHGPLYILDLQCYRAHIANSSSYEVNYE